MPHHTTEHWEKHKLAFLARHNFNTQIESALKIIERQMSGLSFFRPLPIERFRAATHLAQASARTLVCLCLTNAGKREFAPFYLYLASFESLDPPDDAKNAFFGIKHELGW